MTIRATYRLQFTPEFGFAQAAELAPYLARLGVSHVYASPYLKARPGSTHGYDIVDHGALNPELGDAAAFAAMLQAFETNGLGQIIDFVPNHMGVGGSDNPFWLDVLEWGSESQYAGWFDIEWKPDREYLRGKVLVPFLGRQYGTELEAGNLTLKFDAEAGTFAVWAYDTHKLPISPFHYGRILGTQDPSLERLGDSFANLGDWKPQVGRRADELKAELAALVRESAVAATALARSIAAFKGDPDHPETWGALDALIQDQNWRPAHFRVAADDINYRRFFNIAELAGIRMELPALFDHAHRLVFDLVASGAVDGLRIDHIDGLLDPKSYLERLRAQVPHRIGTDPVYLVVEKILGEGEHLRDDWPIDGTTGYEVTNQLLGVLVDPAGEADLTKLYRSIAEDARDFETILRQSKKRIMDNEMASELAALAREAARVALQTNKTADFTRNIIRRALREVVASFPVYRTYVDFSGVATDEDRRIIGQAIGAARRKESAIDPSVFDFLERLLTGDLVAKGGSGFSHSAVLRCAMKFQQYSGPVMAKGLEDTAFYRYNRFLALNEVGGHPTTFGISIAAFHADNEERATHWPRSMLGTSTHDTKRGEDARARLAVLSEFPGEWAAHMTSWMEMLRPEGGPTEPDRNDIYALLQTLIATWPPELLRGPIAADALAPYAERVRGAMTKVMREAKVHSTWAAPDENYEAAMLGLVDSVLLGQQADRFLQSFLPLAERVARLGVQNSLVQTVLKLTMPGMPDIYQGAELWDLSMVDPDNRRPVDYGFRMQALSELDDALGHDKASAMAGYLEAWGDGRIKLAVVSALLELRQEQPQLFVKGSYHPLHAEGPAADQICAITRAHEGQSVAVAVARFPGRRERSAFETGTRLHLPEAAAGGFRDLLTGRTFPQGESLEASALFEILPVAVLVPGD